MFIIGFSLALIVLGALPPLLVLAGCPVQALLRRDGSPSPLSPAVPYSLFLFPVSTIFSPVIRLQTMNATSTIEPMIDQDRQIAEVVAQQQSRLGNFIRRRVPNPADAEDLLQEVLFELVQAHRLLMPIETVTGWLYRVARNRITDLFRKKKPEPFADTAIDDEEGELLHIEDLLPSPDAGPEALYFRQVLLDELNAAIAELPPDQRAVFVAHELEGRSFKDLAFETGVNINPLLARKRYAVLHLRSRLQSIHDEFSQN